MAKLDFSKIKDHQIVDSSTNESKKLDVKITYPNKFEKLDLKSDFIQTQINNYINNGKLESFAKRENEKVIKRKQIFVNDTVMEELNRIKLNYKISIQNQITFILNDVFENLVE